MEQSQTGSTTTTGASYAHPEVLVTTDWVAENLNNTNVRIVEADEDPLLYEIGHLPNAVKLDWHTDVQNPVRRDFVDKAGFEALMRRYGINNDTTVVFYGDKNNWYAAYSYWLFRMYGHQNLRLMNGGRTKWEQEKREYTKDVPSFPATTYTAREPNLNIRAFRRQVEDVLPQVTQGNAASIDVRSPDEYTGKLTAHGQLPAGRGIARRPHPRRARHPLGDGGESRERHVQVRRRAARDLRRQGHHPRQAGHRLLPYRRALGAHLVRADAAPRLPERTQL